MKIKKIKALESQENLSPKDGKRCLAAEFDEAADAEEKADDAPRTPCRKRAASPEGKDGKAKKVKPADTCEDADEDEVTKEKPKKKYPRGSPGKIKKITDRGRVEELGSQTEWQIGNTNHFSFGKFFHPTC